MDIVFAKDRKANNALKSRLKTIINKVKNFKVPETFYYFLILLVVGFGFYFIMLVQNNFSLGYGGDYTGQYIPMAYHVWDYYHDWIKTGHFTLFDQTLYLGVNSYGSNAYYGLFSPFNILIVIFPRAIVPQMMAISSIIKLACAGLFFSIYMEKAFDVKSTVSRICGIAYAFAGWGAFYLWYNNYQDILVFFPIVLLGIEKVLKENKPWVLCVGVFFLTICNYVLMVPYIICAFLYAMFRFFQMVKTRTVVENLKVLGFGVIGFAGGLLMAMFVFGPAIMATLASPKLDSYSYFGSLKTLLVNGKIPDFFKLLFSWKVAPDQHGYIIPERVYYPILEFFIPATTCRSLPSLELQSWDFDDMAVSLWCYIPFIMFLVPALIQSGKEKKWSHYIAFALLVLCLFTPFMYYLTMGMSNGYARWTLFIASSLIAYVGIYLNKIPNVSRWHIHVGLTFALAGIIAAWILTEKLTSPNIHSHLKFIHRFTDYDSNKREYDFTNVVFIVELCYTIGIYLALFFTYYKKAFHILATIFIASEAVVMGNFVTWGHGYDIHRNNGYALNARFKNVLNKVQSDNKSFYRLYTSLNDDWSVNNTLMNNYSSPNFFHSLYNFEIDDFTLWTCLRSGSKSVGGHYRGKYQDVDNLLGVKYYFISKEKSKYNDIEQNNPGRYAANVPLDFVKNDTYTNLSDDFIVYENEYFNDFGYSYSTIYNGELVGRDNREKWYETEAIRNGIVLSTDAVLSKEDSEEIKTITNDINVTYEKSDLSSFKTLNSTNHYDIKYYDLSPKFNKEEGFDAAFKYSFDKIPSINNDPAIDENAFEPVEYQRKDGNRNKATHYFAFYTSKNPGEPLFHAGTTLYAYAPFTGSMKYSFYFIEEVDGQDKIFMYDAHDDDTTDNTCYMRGFYLDRDVKEIAVCGKWGESYFVYSGGGEIINWYTESRDAYVTRREALSANPVKNVKYSSDKFTFSTDYDKDMFVVSQVAYDKGWKITAKDSAGNKQNIKIYKGNGGFVSFVAPKGDISYTMTYKTPYRTVSALTTVFSTSAFFLSLVGYYAYQEKKKQHYLDKIYRENV